MTDKERDGLLLRLAEGQENLRQDVSGINVRLDRLDRKCHQNPRNRNGAGRRRLRWDEGRRRVRTRAGKARAGASAQGP